jgi:transcriptional regulator with XRE-family HTH domain
VGDRLALAIEKTYRQVEFARAIGISESALSLWISGSVPEAWLRLKQACEAANVSADELLGLKPEAEKAVSQAGVAPEDDTGLIRRRILGMLSKLEKGDLKKSDREMLEELERRVAQLESKRAAG